MNLSFKDKVTLVTGAASGMGLAAVQAFAAEFGRSNHKRRSRDSALRRRVSFRGAGRNQI